MLRAAREPSSGACGLGCAAGQRPPCPERGARGAAACATLPYVTISKPLRSSIARAWRHQRTITVSRSSPARIQTTSLPSASSSGVRGGIDVGGTSCQLASLKAVTASAHRFSQECTIGMGAVLGCVSPCGASLTGRLPKPPEPQQFAHRCALFSPVRVDNSLEQALTPARSPPPGSAQAAARDCPRLRCQPPGGALGARRSGSRTSSRQGTPVCAAARGPVSAAADAASPPDCPRGLLSCQATASGPPSARQRARTPAAPCLTTPPPKGHSRKAPAPLRSARAAASSRPHTSARGLCQSLRSWM